MRGLTVIDPELERAEASTAEGMAHWAGGSPNGAKCAACRFYGYSYVKSNGDTASKNAACQKFYKQTGRHGGSLSKSQIGCKYFEKVGA